MKIGITIKLNSGESFQSNGMFQNLLFLAQAFNSVDDWDCYFLYISDCKPDLLLPKDQCLRFDDYLKQQPFKFDLIILGGFFSNTFSHSIFANSKLVVLHCGATMFDDIFHCLTFKSEGTELPSIKIDQIWTLPHHERNLGYLSTLYNSDNVIVVPYVWNSTFIDMQIKNCGYQDLNHFRSISRSSSLKQINIYEPNNTVSKTSLIPLTISVSHQRKFPHRDLSYNIFSAEKIAKSPYFNGRCRAFGITSSEKRTKFIFRPRIPFLNSLAAFGPSSIVLSNQFVHELNNLYFDALYLGLPLIHNSPILSSYGYYYLGTNIFDAVTLIEHVLSHHYTDFSYYDSQCLSLINDYDPVRPSNLSVYVEIISSLVSSS